MKIKFLSKKFLRTKNIKLEKNIILFDFLGTFMVNPTNNKNFLEISSFLEMAFYAFTTFLSMNN